MKEDKFSSKHFYNYCPPEETPEKDWRDKMENLFTMVYISNPQWKIWQGVKQ